MNILLAPHPDDETLFSAYTLIEHHPLVLVCYPGAARHGAPEKRLAELADAMRVLGCDWQPPPDFDLEIYLRGMPEVEHVWAPYPEDGGHSAHNRVGELAVKLWPGHVTWYSTYTVDGRSTVGDRVEAPLAWQELKVRALNCYASQIEHPGTRPHFKRGLEEYLAQPADERTDVTPYRDRRLAGAYKTHTGYMQGAQLEPEPEAGVTAAVSEPGTAEFVCPDCDRKFVTEHGLKIHRTKTHGSNGTNGDQEATA